MQQGPPSGIKSQIPDHTRRIYEFGVIDRPAVLALDLDLQHPARVRGADSFEDGSQWYNVAGVFEPLGRIAVLWSSAWLMVSSNRHARRLPAAFINYLPPLDDYRLPVAGCFRLLSLLTEYSHEN